MKFVDEFRDPVAARVVAHEIARLTRGDRAYKFMEVCGGHTHTIYKHGIEDYLPTNVTLVHGPGCPVCVMPMGRVDEPAHLVGTSINPRRREKIDAVVSPPEFPREIRDRHDFQAGHPQRRQLPQLFRRHPPRPL